jgi:hypothetical protein
METKSRKTDLFKRILSRGQRKPRGQSFVELMLVVPFLALLLAGVVEYGFMLNQYLHVLDGSREAARVENNGIAFDPVDHTIIPTFYYFTAAQAAYTMAPVKLDPAKGDDIIISVFGVAGTNIDRYPSETGWRLCDHYTDFVNYYWTHDPNNPPDPLQSVPPGLADENWYSCPLPLYDSHFTGVDIQNRLVTNTPNAGILLVEIFYNYPQLLKLPVLTSIIHDPILTYVYTIMPLSSAEPTLVPTPSGH